MNNLNHVDLLLTAEEHTVDLADLATDPKMQMRVQMEQETIEQYAEKIDAILEEKPIDVVVVDTHGYETWYVVDGFHRYHAAQLAECRAVRVRLMRGSYEQAVQFAMSANWKNGLRPKKDDAARSISMLLETAPDFGYDSKKVIPWLETFGIPKSTARNNTKALREEIDAKRDSAVLAAIAEGQSGRAIAEKLGIAESSVRNIKNAAQNEPVAQNAHEEDHPIIPAEENEGDACPWFDEDEDFDTTPAINPADAFQKALNEHEAERQESTHQQDKSVQSSSVILTDDTTLKEKIKKMLRDAGIYEDHTKAEVNAALMAIAQGK